MMAMLDGTDVADFGRVMVNATVIVMASLMAIVVMILMMVVVKMQS